MGALDLLAEARIREALARGDLDDLPGRGGPLVLEDLSRMPAELRASYLLMKGAGFTTPELEARRDVLSLHDLVVACGDAAPPELRSRLRRAELRFELLAGRRADSPALAEYGPALLRRLSGDAPGT